MKGAIQRKYTSKKRLQESAEELGVANRRYGRGGSQTPEDLPEGAKKHWGCAQRAATSEIGERLHKVSVQRGGRVFRGYAEAIRV